MNKKGQELGVDFLIRNLLIIVVVILVIGSISVAAKEHIYPLLKVLPEFNSSVSKLNSMTIFRYDLGTEMISYYDGVKWNSLEGKEYLSAKKFYNPNDLLESFREYYKRRPIGKITLSSGESMSVNGFSEQKGLLFDENGKRISGATPEAIQLATNSILEENNKRTIKIDEKYISGLESKQFSPEVREILREINGKEVAKKIENGGLGIFNENVVYDDFGGAAYPQDKFLCEVDNSRGLIMAKNFKCYLNEKSRDVVFKVFEGSYGNAYGSLWAVPMVRYVDINNGEYLLDNKGNIYTEAKNYIGLGDSTIQVEKEESPIAISRKNIIYIDPLYLVFDNKFGLSRSDVIFLRELNGTEVARSIDEDDTFSVIQPGYTNYKFSCSYLKGNNLKTYECSFNRALTIIDLKLYITVEADRILFFGDTFNPSFKIASLGGGTYSLSSDAEALEIKSKVLKWADESALNKPVKFEYSTRKDRNVRGSVYSCVKRIASEKEGDSFLWADLKKEVASDYNCYVSGGN